MDIHQTNYEEYVLDYLEGNLPDDTKKKMDSFFANHPELLDEVSDLSEYTLPKKPVRYRKKETLKKKASTIRLWSAGIAAAIALLALFAGPYLFNNTDKSTQDEYSSINKTEIPLQEKTPVVDTSIQINKEKKAEHIPKQQKLPEPEQINQGKEQRPINVAMNQSKEKEGVPTRSEVQTSAEIVPAPKVNRKQTIKQLQTIEHSTVPLISHDLEGKGTITSIPIAEKQVNVLFVEEKTTSAADDGFTVETFPTEEEMYRNQQSIGEIMAEGNQVEQRSGILTILGIDAKEKKDIKNSLLPKSFGFSEKKQNKNE